MRAAWGPVTAALLGLAATPLAAQELPRLGSCGIAPGGFTLPGTDACLRIGGFVRAEAGWSSTSPRFALQEPVGAQRTAVAGPNLRRSSIGADARLSANLHLPTELGPVRVYVSLRGPDGLATGRAAR